VGAFIFNKSRDGSIDTSSTKAKLQLVLEAILPISSPGHGYREGVKENRRGNLCDKKTSLIPESRTGIEANLYGGGYFLGI
jgi:hypothetical protein